MFLIKQPITTRNQQGSCFNVSGWEGFNLFRCIIVNYSPRTAKSMPGCWRLDHLTNTRQVNPGEVFMLLTTGACIFYTSCERDRRMDLVLIVGDLCNMSGVLHTCTSMHLPLNIKTCVIRSLCYTPPHVAI